MPKRRRGGGGELVTSSYFVLPTYRSITPNWGRPPHTRHTVNSAQHHCPPLLLQLLCSPCCLLRLHALQLLLAHPIVSPIAFLLKEKKTKKKHIEPFCVFSSAPTVDMLLSSFPSFCLISTPGCRYFNDPAMRRLYLRYVWSNSITDLFCSRC